METYIKVYYLSAASLPPLHKICDDTNNKNIMGSISQNTNGVDQQLRRETRIEEIMAAFARAKQPHTSQRAYEVAAVIHVDVVDINVVEVHAPKAGDLSRELQAIAGLPGLLYDGHDLLHALRRGVKVNHLHVRLILVGHLDGQVLQEPRVVLDLRNGYPLHQMAGENAVFFFATLKKWREALLAPVLPRRSGTADVCTPLKPGQSRELHIVR
jgi:hypothetical protein